jgi:hypothetical protein
MRHCWIFLRFCRFAVRHNSPLFARVGGRIGGMCAKYTIIDLRERITAMRQITDLNP